MEPINNPRGMPDNSIPKQKRQDSDTTDKILQEAQNLLKQDCYKLTKDLKALEKDLKVQKDHMKKIDDLLSPKLSPEEEAELEKELNEITGENGANLQNSDAALEDLERELDEELANKKAKDEAETDKIIDDFVTLDKSPDNGKTQPEPRKGVWGIFKKLLG